MMISFIVRKALVDSHSFPPFLLSQQATPWWYGGAYHSTYISLYSSWFI